MSDETKVPLTQPRVETRYSNDDFAPDEPPSDALEPRVVSGRIVGMMGMLSIPTLDTHPDNYPRNFALTDYTGKALLMQAANPSDIEMPKEGVLRIRVCKWVILPDERTDEETGEVGLFPRTVLFDKDGKHFRTSAAHAPRRLMAAALMFGPHDWERGIEFVITERMGARKRKYHDIRLGAQVA